ncbi:MAG: hypothetical protein ACREVX_11345 [Clostridium sp.]|uniref:hypothetical protein n=1 Tax=Clostridium sp. TaxID=1506 RepID=UPI003D6D7109
MENIQKPKVGGWIKTLCILQLIGSVLSLTGISNYSKIDDLNVTTDAANKALGKAFQIPQTTTLSITIGLVLAIILGVSIILILMKKELGIYIYFTVVVAQIVYTIVRSGFTWFILANLIMPILMGIFIWKKKEIFSMETKNIEA